MERQIKWDIARDTKNNHPTATCKINVEDFISSLFWGQRGCLDRKTSVIIVDIFSDQ